MIRIFFLSQSSPILELFPFDKITWKSYICTVVTVMAKQCWSQTVLESGSWGHSVLQTPALVDDLPDLENVVLESDARRVSPADTPRKRLVPSKKRKASDEGRKDGKGRGKKTRKGLALRHFTFFDSLLAAALYFCNEIIVKRLPRGHCDNPNDVCNLLSVAGIVDMVMPKRDYFDEFPYDDLLISKLSSYNGQNSDTSDVDPTQHNKMGIPSLSIFHFNHLVSFDKARSLSFLDTRSDLVKMLDYSWQGTPVNSVFPDGEDVNAYFYEYFHPDLSTNTWTPSLTAHDNLFRPWTYQGQRILRKLFNFKVQFASFPAQFPSLPILNVEELSCLIMATQAKLYGYSDCFGRLFILLKAGKQLALQTIQQNPIIYLWRQQTWAPSCKDLNDPRPPPPPPRQTLSYTDLTRLFVFRVREALIPFDRFTTKGKLLAYITLKRLLGFKCSNFRLFCFLLGFEITSCTIFQIEGINNKEGLCMSIGAMCAFCRNCVEIVNSRMKSNNKLTTRVNFSCVGRLPDVLHVMLKPVSGIVDFHKEDIVMQDLCSGSPDPEVLNCLFEDCPDDIRVVMSTQEFRSKRPRPHLSESIKYRSMTDTETHKRFMSLWAYKYPPASCGGMCVLLFFFLFCFVLFFFKLR